MKEMGFLYQFIYSQNTLYTHQVLCGFGYPCDFTEGFLPLNYLIAKGIVHNWKNSTALEAAQENND